jgi:ATP-binding cassette subfamily F protein uup
MDRLVDHVFVLDGTANVKDIHGNYTDYRSSFEQQNVKKKEESKAETPKAVVKENVADKKKLSFKEQQELKKLETELEKLEAKKKLLLDKMTNGSMSHDEINKAGTEYKKLESEIDALTLRWMELQE